MLFSRLLKTRTFFIYVVLTEDQSIISIFILHQFHQVPTFLIPVSHNIQRKKEKHWSLQISSWSINTTIWLDKRTSCYKLSIKNKWKVSSFHFIFHFILLSVTPQLLRSLWTPHPMEKLLEIFFLFWLSVYMQKINVIRSFHQQMSVIKESRNLIGWKPFLL